MEEWLEWMKRMKDFSLFFWQCKKIFGRYCLHSEYKCNVYTKTYLEKKRKEKKRRVWTNPLRCLGWIRFAAGGVGREGERGVVGTWTVRGRDRQKVIEKKRGRERYSDRDRETECEWVIEREGSCTVIEREKEREWVDRTQAFEY